MKSLRLFILCLFTFISFKIFAQSVNNDFAGYCERDDGSVYATFYKDNCFSNKEISFKQYAKVKNLTINEDNQKIKIAKLQKLLEKDLITKNEFETKKNEILGIIELNNSSNNDNKKIIVKNDTTGPNIRVNKSFIANENFTAIIEGSVVDESEIVEFSIDGDYVTLNNGKFSSSIYVQPRGQQIEIIAIDKKGNKSFTTVNVSRSEIKTVEKKFDFLDPRKIKSKINNNAAALIIGIENYENTFPAPFAENDALAFNDFAFTSLGVPRANIKLLTNEEAERNDTLKILSKWLPQVVIEEETDLYVYYSGHGLASEDGEDLFLLPADGDPELLEDSTLMRNELFSRISELNPRSVTVFLDTCYSGATRTDEFLVAARPIFIEAEEQEVPINFTIFSASAGKETAKILKEAEHGLFSYFLMKGLEGEADSNNDQTITNGELHAFINKNVSRQANQTPQLKGDSERIIVQW